VTIKTHTKKHSKPLLFKAFGRNLVALPDRVTITRKLNIGCTRKTQDWRKARGMSVEAL